MSRTAKEVRSCRSSGVAERDEEALCSSEMAFFPRLRSISQVCTKFPVSVLLNS